jgi:hypothetical protein
MRKRFLKDLRALLSQYSLDLAECGSRIRTVPDLSPQDGTWLGRGIYSKPPRWVVQFARETSGWTPGLPDHPLANRLGYVNARAGRRVGGVAFTIQVAVRTPLGWSLAGNAEWLLVFVSHAPLSPGTSSETFEFSVASTGEVRYQDEAWDFDYGALVAVAPPDRLLQTGPTALSYGEATIRLFEFLGRGSPNDNRIRLVEMGGGSEAEPSEFLKLVDGGWGLRAGAQVDSSLVTLREQIRSHNRSVAERFLSSVRALQGEVLTSFLKQLLISMGHQHVSVTELKGDPDRRALVHCIRTEGLSRDRCLVSLLHDDVAPTIEIFRRSKSQADDAECVVISTSVLGEEEEASLAEAAKVEGVDLIAARKLARYCTDRQLGLTTETILLSFDAAQISAGPDGSID